MSQVAVTFDLGQTLLELDHEMLVRRLAERGKHIDPRVAERETAASWQAYNEAKRQGVEGREAWLTFMRTLLERCGLPGAESRELSDWLWTQQPAHNLWRKPVAGMQELVDALVAADVESCRRLELGGASRRAARRARLERTFPVRGRLGAPWL